MHKIFKPALPLTGFLASFTPAEYNPENGTLKKVIDKSTNVAIYEPGSYNARGQMTHFAMNNKLFYTTLGYDEYGLPTYRMTGNYYPLSSNIQYLETNFDATTGNLNWRKDHKRSLTENFTYDLVHKNRLATWQVAGQQQYSTTYNDVNGNILTKTDFTTPGNPYTYGLNAGPHAVTGIVSPLIMPAEALQEISYNSFNKASHISHNYQRRELFLHYGPDEQRIKTEYKINGQTSITRYFPGGGLEVEVDANGQERWLHYLPGGGLFVCNKDFDKIGMYYVLTDYLGSWDKVISEAGTTVEEYSFDPWGRRRNTTNWTYTGVPANFTFSRGYTGHEMLDAFGLINMNGRMYDPVLGRMLSPDNYVSLPEHTQGYNRYTYALNNPLIITDPSGDNPVLLFIAFAGVLNGAMSAQNGDGFLQGFAIGTATAALSYGVGTAVGPVESGGKIWADMANAGIHTAITGGITYGADALVNNAAFNWKGYGLNIATSMAMAGLSYKKTVMQSQSISLDDLEAAGVQPSLGNGYGMSGGGPKKGRYYYYDPPKNKGGHGFKLNSGNTESFLRREYTYPESYIFTTIGGFAGMYSYMNKIISNDFAKEMAPIISRHYGVPTMPVLKYAKHVPYIGWPADAASIGTSLLNGQNFGWTTERKLDAIFSIIGLIPGYGDAASLFYMGGKDGYKALQKIWDVTRIGFNRIENGIKTLPYWY